MLVLKRLPPSAPAELKALYLRRLHEGLIVCAHARAAHYPRHSEFRPEWGCLSIMAIRGGREEYRLADRELFVDDDSYLVMNASTRYSYRLSSRGQARCIMVSFPPQMVKSVSHSCFTNTEEMLGPAALRPTDEAHPFTDHLAPHDHSVTPVLRQIEEACLMGVQDTEWYREQAALLLMRVLRVNRRRVDDSERIRASKRSTRLELAHRVALATDVIHATYRESLPLAELGRIAGLSPFHLLRAFQQVHGITPQGFLQRKRTLVARRLLATTQLSSRQITERVGFRSRSSLHRWMLRLLGQSPGRIRKLG